MAKQVNMKEVKNLMSKLGLSEEEAIELWKCDNDIEENEEQNELDRKASKVKVSVTDGNKTKGKSKPRTHINSDAKIALWNLLKEFCENIEGAEVTVLKNEKLLQIVYQDLNFKLDLIQMREPKA